MRQSLGLRENKSAFSTTADIIHSLNITWISVIFVNPISSIALRVRSETLPSNEANDVSLRIPAPIAVPGTKNKKMECWH